MTGRSSPRITSTPGAPFVIGQPAGTSKATGIPVDMRFAQVWTFRDGLAARMQMYANVDDALEAAGLSE